MPPVIETTICPTLPAIKKDQPIMAPIFLPKAFSEKVAIPPALGYSIDKKANVNASGILSEIITSHETIAFPSATLAVIPGNIRIPDPKTAPTYKAVPFLIVIVSLK
ncbi:hypothetical protein BN2127_JRS10_05165 [Bacillus subtilis]|nr:hypothetical protein BN2127_JRS10_05165 [Bacillus subtilis]